LYIYSHNHLIQKGKTDIYGNDMFDIITLVEILMA